MNTKAALRYRLTTILKMFAIKFFKKYIKNFFTIKMADWQPFWIFNVKFVMG